MLGGMTLPKLHPSIGPPARLARPSWRVAAAALMLAGCAVTPSGTGPASTAPTPPAAPAADPAADPDAGRPTALMIERQWLQSWFKGTPVRISQRGEGPLDVAVPVEFSFDAGRSPVRPALAAVLDKLAESLRRVPSARLVLLAAPADAKQDARQAATLAAQRGARIRAHLLSRGVPSGQLGAPTASSAPAVQLRVIDSSAP